MEFAEYVAQRRTALFRFAVVLTGDPVLADDILADVLGKAFERWDQVSAAVSLHAYVQRMVVNEVTSWRRRRARTSVWADLSGLTEPVADHSAAHAEHQQLADELRRLPARQRAAVVLRYYEGLSFAEIAELLGTGENAVRSNVSRALRRLRVQLTTDAEDAARWLPHAATEVSR